MGDNKSQQNQRLYATAWIFTLAAALLILMTSAWPLAEAWYLALQPASPEPVPTYEFEISSHTFYKPLGGGLTEWAYLILFCTSMVLHGRSLSQAHSRIAMAACFIVGLACLYGIIRLLIVGAEAIARPLRSSEWGYFFLLSPATPEGTFGFGIVLAVSALAAAAIAQAIVGSGLRFVSSRSTPA